MNVPLAFVCGFVLGIGVSLFFRALNLFIPWLRAFTSGAPVSLTSIIGMTFRGNSPRQLIDALIILKQRGREAVTIAEIERFYLASGSNIPDSLTLAERWDAENTKQESGR